MRFLILFILVSSFFLSCNSSKQVNTNSNEKLTNVKVNDTVTIANDDLEYEIIIIEPGFNFWLQSNARPEGYYSQSFLESRNQFLVIEWNSRVMQPNRFNPNLYEMRIDYQSNIDYGYEVNYKLYNYFVYFQIKYKQKLSGFNPRI